MEFLRKGIFVFSLFLGFHLCFITFLFPLFFHLDLLLDCFTSISSCLHSRFAFAPDTLWKPLKRSVTEQLMLVLSSVRECLLNKWVWPCLPKATRPSAICTAKVASPKVWDWNNSKGVSIVWTFPQTHEGCRVWNTWSSPVSLLPHYVSTAARSGALCVSTLIPDRSWMSGLKWQLVPALSLSLSPADLTGPMRQTERWRAARIRGSERVTEE